jgi:hypothetical protein
MSTEPENKITALDRVPLPHRAAPNRVSRRWIFPTRSDSLERLKASLQAYQHEYEQFKDWYIEKLPPMDDGLSWSLHIDELLITVEEALEGGDEKIGWRAFQTAQRMELYGLAELGRLEPEKIQAPDILHGRAMSIYNEAKSKLTGWRKATVMELLVKDDQIKADLRLFDLLDASRILSEHHENVYRRLDIIRRQFNILAVVALLALATWIGFSIYSSKIVESVALSLSAIILGTLGACTSGIISLANSSTQERVPEKLLRSWITIARPLVGAISALAIVIFVFEGFFDGGSANPESMNTFVHAAAFAAGFSERLLISTVDKFGQ